MPLPINLNLVEMVKALAIDTGVDSFSTNYVLSRLKNEGIRFLVKTLPELGKSVVRSLEVGYLDRTNLTHFAWKSRSLRHFRSLLDQIFNPATGLLLDHPDSVAIWGIRQFSEYFYKLSLEFDEAQLVEAEVKYLATESSLEELTFDAEWSNLLRRNFETYYGDVAKAHPHEVFKDSRPRFGPGSFAFSSHSSVPFPFWKALPTSKIGSHHECYSGFSGYFKSYPSSPEVLSPRAEPKISEVLFVPKDARGPRVISKEPLLLLKGQMSFFDWLARSLERTTDNRVRFYDQSVSRTLARESSLTGENATLDLKDASDRVSFRLVDSVFRNSPAIRWFLSNARSTHTVLPSGKLLRLQKLSGMGSGLTFPLMALLIHVSICSLVRRRTGLPYKVVSRKVHVYGDDVIVPACWYSIAVSALRLSGLLINEQKSFYRGHFRESCGGDYFEGEDVSPVRLKLTGANLERPSRYREGFVRVKTNEGILQLERHVRELYLSGMNTTVHYLKGKLRRSLVVFPPVSGSSPYLGDYTWDNSLIADYSARAYVPIPVSKDFPASCPYKFLGSRFKRRAVGLTHQSKESLDGPARMGLFGEVALPRKVSLKISVGKGVARR